MFTYKRNHFSHSDLPEDGLTRGQKWIGHTLRKVDNTVTGYAMQWTNESSQDDEA